LTKKRRVGWDNIPFMFRLRKPKEGVEPSEIPLSILDEAEAYHAIQNWIATGDKTKSPSALLSEMVIRLISFATKNNLNPVKQETEMNALVRVLNRRFDNLQNAIEDSKAELLRALVQNPRAMQALNEQHKRVGNGQKVDDDFVNNILDDFGR